MAEPLATGRCLCGAVRFAVRGPLRALVVCHCGQCRRQQGRWAAYSAAARDALHLTDAAALAWYASSPGVRRGFCARCGSTLFWDRAARPSVSIAAGALHGAARLEVTAHVHTAALPAAERPRDGRPCHAAGLTRGLAADLLHETKMHGVKHSPAPPAPRGGPSAPGSDR